MHEKMCFQHQGFRDKWLCQQHQQASEINKIGHVGPILNIGYPTGIGSLRPK